MDNILIDFSKKLNQKKEEANFNFGLAVYNKMFERQIKRFDSYSTFSFSVLKKSSFSYFDKYYNYEVAQKLKLYVENDLKIKEKNNRFIRYRKHIILRSIATFSMRGLYNKYHKDITYAYEGLQQYIYNDLHQELVDITSPDGNMCFVNFKQLSKEIIELGYSNENLLNIVLEIVKLNIERYKKLKQNKIPFYYENLKKHKSESISKSQLKRVIKSIESGQINNLSKEEINALINEYSYIKNACEAIYENYINKPQDEKDIQILYDSLLTLKINESICNKIAFSLNKKSKKFAIKKNNNFQFIIPKGKDILANTESVVTKKERRQIIEELETYFDFENMKIIRLLSLEEIVYCVNLLIKNSADSQTINNFITLCIKRIRKENPIYIYNNLYNKFIYFKDKYKIDNIIININKEIEKLFICNDDEYIQAKYVISDYIKFILNEIGNNFEYEKEQANKIKVLNKNT